MGHRGKKLGSPRSSLPEFESEALFLQAVAGLLMRLPGIEGVQILQGPQEFGKDLVFWSTGPLGERINYACVLKRDGITGNASRASGARTALHQVEQALDSPYTDGSGQDVWIHKVYVLTPNNISAEAINSVRGGLRTKAGQIVFMGGHDLFRLFKQYWPDYYSDEASALERYLERLRLQLGQHGPLERLTVFYDLGSIGDVKRIVHVPLDLQRELKTHRIYSALHEQLLQDSEIWRLSQEKFLSDLNDRALQLERILVHLADWELCSSSRNLTAGLERYRHAIKMRWQKHVKIVTQNSAMQKTRDNVARLIGKACPLLHEYEQNHLSRIDNYSPLDSTNTLDSNVLCRALIIDQCLSELSFWRNTKPPRPIVLTGPQWRESTTSLLVAGEPGSGKTSFCKWNALQDIERYSTGESHVLPVYLPLQTLSDIDSSTSLSDLISSAAPFSAFLGDVRARLESGKFSFARLYCDGLDEVPSKQRRSSLIRVLRAGVKADRRLQIIITTRDYVRGNELAWLPRLYLKSLDDRQLRSLCEQWLGDEAGAVREFFRQVREDPPLATLLRVPLLATLTILVFRRTGRLPDNKGRLYSMFVELLAGGWDLAKGVLRPSRFGREVKLIVLARLAERVHRSRKRIFGIQEIQDAADDTHIRLEFGAGWEYFANELLEDGLLVSAGEALKFQFRHLSFQEYLAARELNSSPVPLGATSALEEFLRGDGWWKEVVEFYLLLSGNPRELWAWAEKVQVKDESKGSREYFRSALLRAYPKFKP